MKKNSEVVFVDQPEEQLENFLFGDSVNSNENIGNSRAANEADNSGLEDAQVSSVLIKFM
jgi:hypothetical protein